MSALRFCGRPRFRLFSILQPQRPRRCSRSKRSTCSAPSVRSSLWWRSFARGEGSSSLRASLSLRASCSLRVPLCSIRGFTSMSRGSLSCFHPERLSVWRVACFLGCGRRSSPRKALRAPRSTFRFRRLPRRYYALSCSRFRLAERSCAPSPFFRFWLRLPCTKRLRKSSRVHPKARPARICAAPSGISGSPCSACARSGSYGSSLRVF